MNDQIVKSTFYIAYVFLITTGTVTFIEALRTKSEMIRHVMNLETCISIIAAYFYSQFVEIIKEAEAKGQEIPYAKLNLTRYTDWFISTPFMLFVLLLVLAHEGKQDLRISTLALVLVLNFCMLTVGYLGETRVIDRNIACIGGFIVFAIMFAYIWSMFIQKRGVGFGGMLSFYIFLVVWTFYGIVYLMEEKEKNVAFNILDLIAKAFVGIFFWMYFTKSVLL